MTHTPKEDNQPLDSDFIWSKIPLSPPLTHEEPQLTSLFPWTYPQRTRSASLIPTEDTSVLPSPLFSPTIWSFNHPSLLQERRHSVAAVPIKPITPPPSQQQIDEYFSSTTALFMDVQCLGKGIPLEEVPVETVYRVQFKQSSDYFYPQHDLCFQLNDKVIVEGDRGYDLGQVVGLVNKTDVPVDRVKRLFRHANSAEWITFEQKGFDEQKALVLCQSKIKQRHLNMKVVDAEYQWDRRKLTFYFKANERIDFRELVKELFKIYKTRIWMCAYNPPEKQ